MEKKQDAFIWSYGWWVENDKAWFVEEKSNLLFCVDLNTGVCEEAVCIPDASPDKYALTPLCMKYGREIWCIPGTGQSIWIYHLVGKRFSEIAVDKPEGSSIGHQFWTWNDIFFAVPLRWNRVIEINMSNKKVEHYHVICENDRVGMSVMAGNSIYMLSVQSHKIYQFELNTKITREYILSNINEKLYDICCDNEKFWLSGYRKEIYVWDKGHNSLTRLDDFPEDFGVYTFTENTDGKVDCVTEDYENPTFCYSVNLGEYIWFIPWQTNNIIYVNKESYKLSVYEIAEENETKESILSRAKGRNCKYAVEYIRGDRYIGLFSVKHNRIFEIDAKELRHHWKDYSFSGKCLQQCSEMYKGPYLENDVLGTHIYKMRLQKEYMEYNKRPDNVGREIYLNSKKD